LIYLLTGFHRTGIIQQIDTAVSYTNSLDIISGHDWTCRSPVSQYAGPC